MAVTYRVPGAVLTEREHRVPLDHARRTGRRSRVHPRGRGARRRGSPVPRVPPGRPGLRGDPTHEPAQRLDEARARSSTACCCSTSGGPGGRRRSGATIPGETPADQAAYLAHFRADSIVRDCEAIRARARRRPPWTVLGQSFGGFTTLTYLSFAPEGLRGGADHRRADAGRAVRRRRLRRDVRAGGGGATRATSPATPTTGPASRAIRERLDGRGRAPARRATG